jgi:DNA-directed RNA polymerase specialized sigma24 family protein
MNDLLVLIQKSLATRYAWKLMKILFNQYQIDRIEIVNIIYDRALRSRWLDKFRGTSENEKNVFIKQCTITHLRNLLRSEAKRRRMCTCSYDVVHDKIERGEVLDRYIYTETYTEDDTVSGTVQDEPILVSAPTDFQAFTFTPDLDTAISIRQCASKHLNDEECQMLIEGLSVEEIANELGGSVSNLRLRIKKVRKLFLDEDLILQ